MNKRSKFKKQRYLGVELPGLGKAGALAKRPYAPGMHGLRRRKASEYAVRLQEKQKVRFHYDLRERYVLNMVKKAKSGNTKNWAEEFFKTLELRLDNVIFRLGFAGSIPAARQMVVHGHVNINGAKCDRPSRILEVGDAITVSEKMAQNPHFQSCLKSPRLELPAFLAIEESNGVVGKVAHEPSSEDVPFPLEIQYVIEYYGKV